MFHEAPPGTVCKCKVIVQCDTTDDSERSESTPHSVASGVQEERKTEERLKEVTRVKSFNEIHSDAAWLPRVPFLWVRNIFMEPIITIKKSLKIIIQWL